MDNFQEYATNCREWPTQGIIWNFFRQLNNYNNFSNSIQYEIQLDTKKYKGNRADR